MGSQMPSLCESETRKIANEMLLMIEHDAFANASWAGMAERLGLMNRRLVGLGLEPLDDLGRDG
jgi:hypothetical protein